MALGEESFKSKQNVKVEISNPWMASSIYEFQYFCCPQCDEKSHDKQKFVNHASSHSGVSFAQCATIEFIKKSKPSNKTYSGLISMHQGFQICIA